MRKVLGLIVMCCALAGLSVGCASGADEAEHNFTRDSSGGAIPVDSALVDESSFSESFDRAEQNVVAADSASCSGACNATTCVCSGDLDCCIAGCIACWEVVN